MSHLTLLFDLFNLASFSIGVIGVGFLKSCMAGGSPTSGEISF